LIWDRVRGIATGLLAGNGVDGLVEMLLVGHCHQALFHGLEVAVDPRDALDRLIGKYGDEQVASLWR
jgi:hypothetical protein